MSFNVKQFKQDIYRKAEKQRIEEEDRKLREKRMAEANSDTFERFKQRTKHMQQLGFDSVRNKADKTFKDKPSFVTRSKGKLHEAQRKAINKFVKKHKKK